MRTPENKEILRSPVLAVLFDLDGTLVHTESEWRYLVVGQSLKKLGLDTPEKPEIDRFWFGHNREEIILSWGVEPLCFWPIYSKIEIEKIYLRRDLCSVYSDATVVKEIKNRGIKTGIVTNAQPAMAKIELGLLEKTLGGNFIDHVVVAHGETKVRQKPDPQGLELCLQGLEIQSFYSLMVGNGEEDILAAQTASIRDVLLVRGEHEVSQVTPTHKIYSLEEILRLL